MKRPLLVPLGGFLGAGKTTLILAASRLLQAQGLRPAAILNDQGSDLVDTRYVEAGGVQADQVSGGCFCCRFSDPIEAAGRLEAYGPDVIFAEAVGSCTDIAATTLRPIQQEFGDRFRVAPFSVLVDPARALELSASDDDLAFVYRKQIEEADLVCFTKSDIREEYPSVAKPARYLSPLTGSGVAEWLSEVMEGQLTAAGHLLDIDYAVYARAEAMLAWLNCRAAVTLRNPLPPPVLAGPLLDQLDGEMSAAGMRIAHLKVFDEAPMGYIKASIVRNGDDPSVEGMLVAEPAARHELLLNIRAAGDPQALDGIVQGVLARIPGEIEILNFQCFRPAAPKPERRVS